MSANANAVPATVSTAHLLLRGLVPALLGCPIGKIENGELQDMMTDASAAAGVRASAFQMTYRKDAPRLTGKFTLGLGKRHGSDVCALALPREDESDGSADGSSSSSFPERAEEFFAALETAANRLIRGDGEGGGAAVVRAHGFASVNGAVEALSSAILDAGQLSAVEKKKKQAAKAEKEGKPFDATEEPVGVGEIATSDGAVVSAGMIHGGLLCGDLSRLGKLTILRSNPRQESNMMVTKKKCEVTIKFMIEPAGDDDDLVAAVDADGATIESLRGALATTLMAKDIRLREGLELRSKWENEDEKKRDDGAAPLDPDPLAAAATPGTDDDAAAEDDEMVVTAFEVSGIIDYDKLIQKFGSKEIDASLLSRLESLTVGRGTVPRLHRFLRRGIFFSHRDLGRICDLLEKNEPFYLYTGRGPSSAAMHLGHLVPFLFTAWLQKAFRCPLVIQMTDDEKFLFKGTYEDDTGDNLDDFSALAVENARDIVACGFDPAKTFLFTDLEYVGVMYPNIVRIWKAVTVNNVNGIFGFDGTSNLGKVAFPAVQAAPSFPSSFPTVFGPVHGSRKLSNVACLIPCAIDQDPYFRMTRDVAHKMVPKSHPLGGKPALIHSKFFPPLQGARGKMSSSDGNSAVFLTDHPDDIERKIRVHAFSGGQETMKLQREVGADLESDVSYQWLRFFLEDDDELERIGREYGSGTGEYWSTGAVKGRLIDLLKGLVAEHCERRAVVTDAVVKEWMTERCIL